MNDIGSPVVEFSEHAKIENRLYALDSAGYFQSSYSRARDRIKKTT